MELKRLFERYGWAADEPEPGIWRARFSAETDEEFDLYALKDDQWLRLAVTPLRPPLQGRELPRALLSLLEANGKIAGARFALDGDGDIALQGDLPVVNLTFAQFATLLDEMILVVNEVAAQGGRWP
jgi:hypothetical protein